MIRLPGWLDRLLGWPPVAHHVAALRRANGLRFTRWAAAIALFGYLSLFPLATLAFAVLSAVLASTPELMDQVQQAISDALPGLLGTTGNVPVDLTQTSKAATSAGVVGAVLLLVAGLGWVDAMIEGTRRMLGVMRRPRNFVLLRIEDAGWLVLLGLLLLTSLVVSVGVRTMGTRLLDTLDIASSVGSWVELFGPLVSVLLTTLTLTLLYGFAWNRTGRRWRTVVGAALMAALVLELMSLFIFVLVGHTLSNPVYGTLAVAAALLVYLYWASSVVLYVACWLAVKEGRDEPAEAVAYNARRPGSEPLLP